MAPTKAAPKKSAGGPKGPKQPALAAFMARGGWLTPAEAAKQSGIALSTLYAWIARNIVRTKRGGLKRVFVSGEDLRKVCGPSFGAR